MRTVSCLMKISVRKVRVLEKIRVGEDGGFATFRAPIRSLNVTLFAFFNFNHL
jgi:hypothetical protein